MIDLEEALVALVERAPEAPDVRASGGGRRSATPAAGCRHSAPRPWWSRSPSAVSSWHRRRAPAGG